MNGRQPGVFIWPVSPSTFKKGPNSDGSDRVQPRQKPGPESQQQQIEPDKGKRKTHRLKPAGRCPSDCHDAQKSDKLDCDLHWTAPDCFIPMCRSASKVKSLGGLLE